MIQAGSLRRNDGRLADAGPLPKDNPETVAICDEWPLYSFGNLLHRVRCMKKNSAIPN